MPNKHYRSWIIQMPLGFLFTTASIILIMFSVKNRPDEPWIVWAAISACIFMIGLMFLGNSLIHKIKSDLIRKNQRRRMTTAVMDEEEHVA